MKTIVDNIAVEYKDEGQGPVLLLLHGWMHSLTSFDELTKLLADRYRVVRLDMPGFGTSELPPKPWYVADYASFVRDFLRRVDLEPVAIVGHSFGGRVILKGFGEGTLTAPKIVLIDAAGNAKRNTPKALVYRAIAKIGKALSVFVPRSLYTALRKRLYRHTGSDYLEAGALSQTYLNTINEDLTLYARRIKVPTLLVWGELDATTPLEDGKRLAAAIEGSRMEIVAGAGHVPHQDKPSEVAGYLRSFV
ncbi:MAG: alpha/beta hydrolase [Candidatus Pacebacteria bacterium]|nr:alpha/beta hydrolase [Candidatus Paceibacterota bacterium]